MWIKQVLELRLNKVNIRAYDINGHFENLEPAILLKSTVFVTS